MPAWLVTRLSEDSQARMSDESQLEPHPRLSKVPDEEETEGGGAAPAAEPPLRAVPSGHDSSPARQDHWRRQPCSPE